LCLTAPVNKKVRTIVRARRISNMRRKSGKRTERCVSQIKEITFTWELRQSGTHWGSKREELRAGESTNICERGGGVQTLRTEGWWKDRVKEHATMRTPTWGKGGKWALSNRRPATGCDTTRGKKRTNGTLTILTMIRDLVSGSRGTTGWEKL